MIAEGDDRQAFEDNRRRRPLDVLTRARPADAGFAQVGERVEQRLGAVVERVVVGKRDAVDADVHERLHRLRRSAEVERFGHRLATIRDAALEVEDAQVGGACEFADLGRDERLGRSLLQLQRNAAAEHRVAGKCKPHGASMGVCLPGHSHGRN